MIRVQAFKCFPGLSANPWRQRSILSLFFSRQLPAPETQAGIWQRAELDFSIPFCDAFVHLSLPTLSGTLRRVFFCFSAASLPRFPVARTSETICVLCEVWF